MGRYNFLKQDEIFAALNKLRASFLAAKDGSEVDEIINSVLTFDEKLKIGRRILIEQLLSENNTYDYIIRKLKAGKGNVASVDKTRLKHPMGFRLINKRVAKVESTFTASAYEKVGGPKLVYKSTRYTGFKRKDVKR
jgi:uncharacterized protein YerC